MSEAHKILPYTIKKEIIGAHRAMLGSRLPRRSQRVPARSVLQLTAPIKMYVRYANDGRVQDHEA
jgi:hypothetical protein